MPPELKPRPDSTLEEYFAQQFVRATALPMAGDILRVAETWRPDVIVRERTEFGGAIAADALGISSVAVQVGNQSLLTPAVLAAVAAPYNAARVALGLPPDRGLAALEDQRVFSFAPGGLHDPAVLLPRNILHMRANALDVDASVRLPAWAEDLGRDRPLVYATLGTVFNEPTYKLPFFPAVLEGLRNEPLDLIVTVGPDVDPAYLGVQPANVHVERFVPQSLLFPKVAVIACHGGFGTLLAAVEHAVPLVLVPFGADQYINAASVERLGIGIVLNEDDLTMERMRSAVTTLLEDDSYRNNVRKLRDAAAELPSASEGVGLLERMARGVPRAAASGAAT